MVDKQAQDLVPSRQTLSNRKLLPLRSPMGIALVMPASIITFVLLVYPIYS